MTRILYLTTSGQVGGAERCLLSLAHGLDRSRFAPHVLVGSPGPLDGLLADADIPHQIVPLPPGLRQWSSYHRSRGLAAAAWRLPAYLAQLRRAGRAAHPALVHSNGAKMHYLGACLARGWGAPLLWHLHDFPRNLRGLNWFASRVNVAVANSAAVAAAYRLRCPALAPKLRTIPNGVATDALRDGDGAAFRARWGLRPDAPVIGMIAIFAPWKGQEVFLRAARLAKQQIPSAQFVLVGDDIYDTAGHGRQRQHLEQRAADLGLGPDVRFTGFLERDLASAYAGLDLLVHASTEPEPFGRTAIEAMAAGTPVIAAADGGMLEIVEDGVSGRLTPPGDVEALATAMIELARAPETRRRLAERARLRVREHFDEAVVARRWEALYRELAP